MCLCNYNFTLLFSFCLLKYTEERLGTSDKTELDAHFETLAQRSDRTKFWTERLVGKTEAVLQPNPSEAGSELNHCRLVFFEQTRSMLFGAWAIKYP